MQPGSTFAVSDVVPVCNQLSETGVVVVRADSPWKTLKELVAACKERASCAARPNGVEASNHTAAQLLATSAGFNYKAIPYGGTADQLRPCVRAKCSSPAPRWPTWPRCAPATSRTCAFWACSARNVCRNTPMCPPWASWGYYGEWYGSARALVLPKGVSQEIVDFYVNAFRKTMQDPACIEAHAKAGMSLDFKDNKQLAELIAAQESSAAIRWPSSIRSSLFQRREGASPSAVSHQPGQACMKRSDIGVTVIIYAFTLFFLVMTLDLPSDAQAYPLCLIGGLLALNTLYLARCLLKARGGAGIINDLPESLPVFSGSSSALSA